MRLGWGGDYQSQTLQSEAARAHFFTAIERYAPHVLEELAKEPAETFQPLYDRAATFSPYESCSYDTGGLDGWLTFEHADEQYMPLHFRVRKALKRWGATYRLEEPWIYDCALYTLHCWCRYGKETRLRFHQTGLFKEIPFVEKAFTLCLGPADLKLKAIGEEKERFDAEYERARDEYFSKLAAEAEQHWPKAAKPEELERHLEWLIHYRINGLSAPKLTQKYHRSKTTIYGALNKLYELLELAPAQRQRGRPKKSQ